NSVAISPFPSLFLLLSFASKEEARECGRGIEGFGVWRYVIGYLCLQYFCSGNAGSFDGDFPLPSVTFLLDLS
ncbi:unnamed protein product, partial [Musa textilis]